MKIIIKFFGQSFKKLSTNFCDCRPTTTFPFHTSRCTGKNLLYVHSGIFDYIYVILMN